MKIIEVYPIGMAVHVGDDAVPIAARITGICLSGKGSPKVRYEVSYWEGATHREIWLDGFEVRPHDESETLAQIKFSDN